MQSRKDSELMKKKCFECRVKQRYKDKLYCKGCIDKPKQPFTGGSAALQIYDKI